MSPAALKPRLRCFRDCAQVQGEWALRVHFCRRDVDAAGSVADLKEPREAAAFGLVGVYGQGGVVASARMCGVESATAEGARIPAIGDIERQRRMDADRRVQAFGGVPGAETHARDELAGRTGG